MILKFNQVSCFGYVSSSFAFYFSTPCSFGHSSHAFVVMFYSDFAQVQSNSVVF